MDSVIFEHTASILERPVSKGAILGSGGALKRGLSSTLLEKKPGSYELTGLLACVK